MSNVAAIADQLAQQGRVEEAYAALEQAGESGDAAACYALGLWRLSGAAIRRDLGAARDWFGRAAAAGHLEARHAYIALLANGAGGTSPAWPQALAELDRTADRDARSERDLLGALTLDDQGAPTEPPCGTRISSRPDVVAFPALLSPPECAWLIDRAAPALEPAVIVDPVTGAQRLDPVRKARSAHFPLIAESPLIHAINRRIAAASGTSWAQGEPLQVLAYNKGDEFKPHSDAIAGIDNQRVLTMLVYLNDNYGGGETHFLGSGLKYKGKTGDGLLFRSVLSDGRADPQARHAGLPVRAGTKMLLSKWIRERPLDLSGPPGRPF